jgi:predicted DNA-binding transcriptional regulator YafY
MSAEDAIAEAARNLRTVILTYVDVDGAETTREVEPYSYRPGKEGGIRFMAFDIQKSAMRGFRNDRIVSAAVTENTYTPQWAVEIA